MPESKSRKKPAPVPAERKPAAAPQGNPRWLVPTMIALLVIGLLWVVVTYITQQAYPIAALGGWNLAIGFAFMLAGMALAMRWR